MSRTFHHGERRIRVRGIRRASPDLRRLARALIELAQAQAETDAAAQDRQAPIDASKPQDQRPGGRS